MENKKTNWELYEKFYIFIEKILNSILGKFSHKINDVEFDRLLVRGERELENACKNYDPKKSKDPITYFYTCLNRGITGELLEIIEENKREESLEKVIGRDEDGKVLRIGDIIPAHVSTRPDSIYNRIEEGELNQKVKELEILPEKIFKRVRLSRKTFDKLLPDEIKNFVNASLSWIKEGTEPFEKIEKTLKDWRAFQDANKESKKQIKIAKKEVFFSEKEKKARARELREQMLKKKK
jgi:hypothetical protein